LKFGAKEEGTLRRHSIYPSGYVRDAIFFSVIREEWPDVKRGLEERLARFATSQRREPRQPIGD